jgi:hypothetical protein
VDNDEDGAVDCADSDCDPGYECVDAPEDGWTGYARVQEVPYPAAEPPEPCPDGSEPAVYYAGETGPAECTACGCTWSGATCSAPELRCYYGSLTCGNNASIVTQPEDTTCVNPPTPGNNFASCRLGASAAVVSAGTCTAAGGENTNLQPWETEIRVCAPAAAGGGCGTGQACAPKPPTGFDGAVCMTQAGSSSCPADWTDIDLQAYDDFTDSRACAACGCDTGTITCSGGKYTLYDRNDCMTQMADPPIDVASTSCVDATDHVDNSEFSYRPQLGTPSEGTCGTTAPTGTLEKTGETKICCKQPP